MRKTIAVLNIVALIVMLGFNFAADLLPINSISTAAISDKYANLFTPAGITFAIWGLIYVALIAFALYIAKLAFGKKSPDQKLVDAVGPWFILSSVLNALWIVAWHYDQISLSVLLIIGMLISLIALYVNMHSVVTKPKRSLFWLVFVPISIYLGWISVATIANVAVLLTKLSWSAWGIGPGYWVVLMLVAGLILALLMLARYADYAYGFVIIWAYLGIIINRSSNHNAADAGIIAVASLSIIAILLVSWARYRKQIS